MNSKDSIPDDVLQFSEIYSEFDRVEQERMQFRRRLEKEMLRNYSIFYEKLRIKLNIDEIFIAAIFSFILLTIHSLSGIIEYKGLSGVTRVLTDWSFFLSLLNGIALYLVYTATRQLRDFLINVIQLSRREPERSKEHFIGVFKKNFLDNRNAWIIVSFGFINLAFAFIFGIPYLAHKQYFLLTTFLIQIFLIGCIGGITITGLITVIRIVKDVSIREDMNLTYLYPDNCAGTLVIGNMLFYLSLHFIAIGVAIFVFIYNFPWTGVGIEVRYLMMFWQLFPFILSGLIFFVPVKKINSILQEYKLYEQLRVRKRMRYLSELMLNVMVETPAEKEKIEAIDSHYQKLKVIDEMVSELSTWPYDLKKRTIFLSVFIPVISGAVSEMSWASVSTFVKGIFRL